jgi:hypothetical protein
MELLPKRIRSLLETSKTGLAIGMKSGELFAIPLEHLKLKIKA